MKESARGPILGNLWQLFHIRALVGVKGPPYNQVIDNGNKPAAQAAGKTLPDATPLVGKIHQISKLAVTFEPKH